MTLQDYLQEEHEEFEKKFAEWHIATDGSAQRFGDFVVYEDLKDWLRSHDERLLAKVREMVETKIKENNLWKKEGVCYLCIEDNHCIHDIENVAYNEVLSSLEA